MHLVERRISCQANVYFTLSCLPFTMGSSTWWRWGRGLNQHQKKPFLCAKIKSGDFNLRLLKLDLGPREKRTCFFSVPGNREVVGVCVYLCVRRESNSAEWSDIIYYNDLLIDLHSLYSLQSIFHIVIKFISYIPYQIVSSCSKIFSSFPLHLE